MSNLGSNSIIFGFKFYLFLFYIVILYLIIQTINYTYKNKKGPAFITLLNNTLLIYRAIEDKRNNIIRILAAMYMNINKSLVIIKVNNKIINYTIVLLGLVIKFNIEFPLKYVNFVFTNRYIKNIKVNNKLVEFTKVKYIKLINDFTVCITSVKNNFTAKTIVDQTLKIYQKEGVSHAIIYYGDISKEVYDILYKYVKSGFLEIIYWPEQSILSYIRNNGQILKMNDCLYRSYHNSKYIINSDIDEIIMPKSFYTLKELISYYLQSNPNCGMFQFYSKTFPTKNYIDNISKYGRKSYFNLPTIEDVNLYEKTLSCKETMIRTKYIISTKNVEAIRFHDAVTIDKKCRIKTNDGHCRHTRLIPKNILNLCRNTSHDYTIVKYS